MIMITEKEHQYIEQKVGKDKLMQYEIRAEAPVVVTSDVVGELLTQETERITVTQKEYESIQKQVGPEKLKRYKVVADDEPRSLLGVIDAKNGISKTPFDLSPEINNLHNEIKALLRTSLEKALKIGELLDRQKQVVEYGQFGKWVSRNIDFSHRTVQNYMRLYRYKEEIKNANVSYLTEAYNLIEGKAINPDEIIDADDSLNVEDHLVVISSSVDKIALPKKKAKGPMTKTVITPNNLDSLRTSALSTNNVGNFRKIVVVVPDVKDPSANPEKIQLYGEFLYEAIKLLKTGGKIIFHKRG